MNSVVIYGSRHGNTRKVAAAIVRELRQHGKAQLMSADDAPDYLPVPTDLVVVGGPTETHSMTEAMTRFFNRVPDGAMSGIAAAGFDTRVRLPRFLSGSAGAGIVARLRSRGAQVIAKEESFFVIGVTPNNVTAPVLAPGELQHAAAWAASLAAKLESTERALAAPASQKTLTGQDLRP